MKLSHKLLLSAAIGLALHASPALAVQPDKGIDWVAADAAAFERAGREERLLLLDLVAVWCHWCHVMEKTTYANAEVQAQIARHYVAMKADHDARPDLAERYRDYGWPATVILTPDGRELVKRAGYIAPDAMRDLLAATAARTTDAPAVGSMAPSLSESGRPSAALITRLHQRHLRAFDAELGGLDQMQKFLDADSVEYDMQLAADGDREAERRVHKTLGAAARLIDPAFGGAYQYSTHGDWDHPHYEKIAATQAAYLRVYSEAYRQFGNPQYLRVAAQVGEYLLTFWQSAEGGFYNSQDADLKQGQKAHDYFALSGTERLKLGTPRIDRHRYASSNGQLIEGLVSLYEAGGEQRFLGAAVEAFSWVMRERRRPDGGLNHDAVNVAGPYLADNLHMARALLAMYRVSGETRWLDEAERVAAFIGKQFSGSDGGLLAAADNGTPVRPVPQLDQNIQAARFLADLLDLRPTRETRALARHAMRYLASDAIALSRLSDPGILLAERALERRKAPAKGDRVTRFAAPEQGGAA